MPSNDESDFQPTTPPRPSRSGALPGAGSGLRAPVAARAALGQDAYPATQSADIGRPAGENLRELYVSCDPAPALLQQFDHAQPEFIAVHDVGTGSSRKLLSAIGEATRQPIRKLAIRRQGYGTTLATLEYVEFAAAEGGMLRLYSTEADADEESRRGLARVLLAYSRLGVLMLGDLPGHALAAALKPLRDDIIAGPWPNRDLLLVPVVHSAALAAHGGDLGRGTGVTVRTTPAAVRPSDAWNFISGAWGRLRGMQGASARQAPPSATPRAMSAGVAPPARIEARAAPSFGPAAHTPTLQPLSLRPMPPTPQTQAPVTDGATGDLLARYVQQLQRLGGMLCACVFEAGSGYSLAYAGSGPQADTLGAVGSGLLASLTRAALRLQDGAEMPDAAITLDARHLVLRPVPRHPGLVLLALLDRQHANLTLARLQIQRMDELFGDPSTQT
jgi:hypothetical protein